MNVPLLVVLLLALAPAHRLRGALHVHSTFSTGKHTMDELALQASRAGIDVLVLNDHYMDEIAYGAPLFREAFRVKLSSPSLTPRTLVTYLATARRVEARTGIIVLPGVELTPYYYWEGSILSNNLVLRSAGRQLLVVFPEDGEPADLSKALTNPSTPAGRTFSPWLLWPLLPGAWALRRVLSPAVVTARTRRFIVRKKTPSLAAWLILAGSASALVLSWPFTAPRWSPYARDAGAAPYQAAIDRATGAGALIFWTHPETGRRFRHPDYPVGYRSEPYTELIRAARGVTGFAALYEGYRQAAAPGGPWDQALVDFCRGQRPAPIWTVGEIDFHEAGEAGGKRLGEVETILRARNRSRQGALEALSNGSCYAVRHGPAGRLVVDELSLSLDGQSAHMGGRVVGSGPRLLRLRLHRTGPSPEPVEILVVREGRVVYREALELGPEPRELQWEDSTLLHSRVYYRVQGKGKYPEMFFTNPIFASPRGEGP